MMPVMPWYLKIRTQCRHPVIHAIPWSCFSSAGNSACQTRCPPLIRCTGRVTPAMRKSPFSVGKSWINGPVTRTVFHSGCAYPKILFWKSAQRLSVAAQLLLHLIQAACSRPTGHFLNSCGKFRAMARHAWPPWLPMFGIPSGND